MTVQHTHELVTTSIIVTGAETEHPIYMGCVGRIAGESWQDTETRWNGFARTMWEFGVEPTEDEPFFTIVDDGVIWDHYTLREVEQDGVDPNHPLADMIEGNND